jgi:FKBP-type peptidyl-prolyl cis-trans isomerase (trigger factor)
MSLQVEKLEKNMAKLTIEVSAEELEKAIQGAYQKQKGNISVPGFRKGKVPRQMIEKMYGVEIFYEEAANALIPTAYSKAYDECDLEIYEILHNNNHHADEYDPNEEVWERSHKPRLDISIFPNNSWND